MTVSEYEIERQRRIEENKQRLLQIGIDQTVASVAQTTAGTSQSKRKRARNFNQNAYNREADDAKASVRRRSRRVAGQEAEIKTDLLHEANGDFGTTSERHRAQEVYTKDHVLALGPMDRKEWVLFEDGYDANGNRIYCKVVGKTCHQCRQKTVSKHTACTKCESLQGVFCGDCLFMRYGENIDQVGEMPDWICPCCRDICNCSFHRTKKGWSPTGTLYRYAIAQGYPSVAHYLVLNNLQDDEESLKAAEMRFPSLNVAVQGADKD
eukprot:jgi/Picsp_1/2518/NSC_00749-R1_protein